MDRQMDIIFLLTLMMLNKKWDILSKNHFTSLELYIISYYGSVIYQIAISTKTKLTKIFSPKDVMLERWNSIELLKKNLLKEHSTIWTTEILFSIHFSHDCLFMKNAYQYESKEEHVYLNSKERQNSEESSSTTFFFEM